MSNLSLLVLECFGGPLDGRIVRDFAGCAYYGAIYTEGGLRYARYRIWKAGEPMGLYFLGIS